MKNLIMLFVVVVFFLACNNKNKTVQEIPAAAMEEALENASVLQYDYANGNGTILKIEYSDYVRWIFRKHEQRAYNDRKLSILDKPNGTEIFSLGTDNYFNIVEMALEENLLDQGKKCWLKIKDDEEREGWVQGENRDPYADGLGSFIEIINIGNKDWTGYKTR